MSSGLPFMGKPTYADYGDFKGLKEKPIKFDRLKNASPLSVDMPFSTESLYNTSFKPYKIGKAGSNEPRLEKVDLPDPD